MLLIWRQRHNKIFYLNLGEHGFNLLAWQNGELQMAFYAHRHRPEPDRQAVIAAFSRPPDDRQQRLALLGGRVWGGKAARGAIICSCFAIDEIAIGDAVRQGCHSVQQLGGKLKCGTHCGSCVPELKKLITRQLKTLAVGDNR